MRSKFFNPAGTEIGILDNLYFNKIKFLFSWHGMSNECKWIVKINYCGVFSASASIKLLELRHIRNFTARLQDGRFTYCHKVYGTIT